MCIRDFVKRWLKPGNKYNSRKYSRNVWLSTVFGAPALLMVVLAYMQDCNLIGFIMQIRGWAVNYALLVSFEWLISVLPAAIFREMVIISTIFKLEPIVRQWIICLAGVLVAAGTCSIIFIPFDFFNDKEVYLGLLICNGLVAGACTWIYPLKEVSAI